MFLKIGVVKSFAKFAKNYFNWKPKSRRLLLKLHFCAIKIKIIYQYHNPSNHNLHVMIFSISWLVSFGSPSVTLSWSPTITLQWSGWSSASSPSTKIMKTFAPVFVIEIKRQRINTKRSNCFTYPPVSPDPPISIPPGNCYKLRWSFEIKWSIILNIVNN